ncbi:hypothetical protein, partial [Escherichia coli]|uniref:hypothetical protein n=1 Tax=Escherichia coli TaxID=562 RepID=UPI0039FCB8CB
NANALATAQKQQDLVTESQNRMGKAVNSTTQRIREQNDAIVKNAQIATLSERDRVNAMAAADKEAFAKREGVTQEQIAAYNAARDKEAQQDIARIDKTEKEKNDRINKAAANRAAAAAKREANEAARQQKAADDFLAQVDRTSGDEIARINATEQQKLAKLDEFQKQGTISAQEYEQAKTDIQLAAEDARQKELDKRQQEA